ncbi:MAG: TolC family protein [Elusimicrobia bacterium]|nr:TolC family protein [Candidatus Liberimonas magnetica]
MKHIFFHKIISFSFLLEVILLICPLKVFCADVPVDQKGLSLENCYLYSLNNSLDIAIKKESGNETKGRYKQAVGAVLPKVSFSALYLKQGVDQDSSLPQSFGSQDNTQNKLSFSQPVFNGFKEFSALSILKDEQIERSLEELRARQTLLVEVSESFYNLIEYSEAIKTYEEIKTIIEQRIKDLEERVKLGRSRESEIASTKVLYYHNQVELQTLKNQKANEEKKMKYLTGLDKLDVLNDSAFYPDLPSSEETYTKEAESRPDVAGAKQSYLIAHRRVSIAKSGFMPSINLNAGYYMTGTGRYAGISWDALVNAELPLIPFTNTAGNVDEAVAVERQAGLSFESAKRKAVLEISTFYEDFRYALENKEAYDNALKANEENYNFQLKDYKLNLINTLELLTTIHELQDARRFNVHAVNEVKRAYFRLLVSSGQVKY